MRPLRLTALLLSLALPRAALADPAPPNLNAGHAFVGDPLFGLDTPAGTLFNQLADEQTAIASTTKVQTLRLALRAVANGQLHMDDLITVSALAASIGGSSMQDIFSNPLQTGEVVAFKDLLRGMMYPSGNNAAWAIAEAVAKAIKGPSGTKDDFIAKSRSY